MASHKGQGQRMHSMNAMRVILQVYISVHNGYVSYWETHLPLVSRASVAVFAFFAMSGLMAHHTMDQEMDTEGGAMWWIAHRIWRLFPAHSIILLMGFVFTKMSQSLPSPVETSGACESSGLVFEAFFIDAALPKDKEMLLLPHGRCLGLGWYIKALVQLTMLAPLLVSLTRHRFGIACLAATVIVPVLTSNVPFWWSLLKGGIPPFSIGIFASMALKRKVTHPNANVVWSLLGWLSFFDWFVVQAIMDEESWSSWGAAVGKFWVPVSALAVIINDTMRSTTMLEGRWLSSLGGVTYEMYLLGSSIGNLTYKVIAPTVLGSEPTTAQICLFAPIQILLQFAIAYPLHFLSTRVQRCGKALISAIPLCVKAEKQAAEDA